MNYREISSPIGTLRLASDGQALCAIEFAQQYAGDQQPNCPEDPVLNLAEEQLEAYFNHRRKDFDLPLADRGTAFQKAVWKALRTIPYGELRSYRDIALKIGRENAVRAVGAANGRNPLPIVVPCHRVVGSNGRLTGFSGGLDAKQQLLALEGAVTRR